MQNHLRIHRHMAMVVSPSFFLTGTYQELLEVYQNRLNLLHRGAVKAGDLPPEQIYLMSHADNTWVPVRFEPGELDHEVNQIVVKIMHHGGSLDGKPYAFPGSPMALAGSEGVEFGVDIKED